MDAWTVSDHALYRILRAYLQSLPGNTWFTLDLYTNDYTPQPGDVTGDYDIVTVGQWPGYVGWRLPAPSWTELTVTNHVASSYQAQPALFVFPPTISSFTIYGYFVTDGFGNLQWAERFPAPIPTEWPGDVSIQPYLNVGILAASAMMMAARRDDDDHDDGDDDAR